MKLRLDLRLMTLSLVCLTGVLCAQSLPAETSATNCPIDLPTALRLAGAQNLDIQIARQRLQEAAANQTSAWEQFFPSINPGLGLHRRDGVAQAVPAGVISDAHYQSYSPGATLSTQLALGEAIYHFLASKQLTRASDQALEIQRQNTTCDAALAYFELVRAKALVDVAADAVRVSNEYQQELHAAVEAGIAFKGDELRVQTESERHEVERQSALKEQRIAGVQLSRILHLDAQIELIPATAAMLPIQLFGTNASAAALVKLALQSRPEVRQSQAWLAAAQAEQHGSTYGPLVPAVGAQVFAGGLGGGPDGAADHLGPEADYTVGLSWRIGPGGLFDPGRTRATKARVTVARLNDAKLGDAISAEVVTALARVRAAAVQVELTRKNLATATETLRLTRGRQQAGVGIVLENVQAQQALVEAQSRYVAAVTEHNLAQYTLNRAVGGAAEKPPLNSSP